MNPNRYERKEEEVPTVQQEAAHALRAEARAVEEGHRAWVDPRTGQILVHSESNPSRPPYRVSFAALIDTPIVFYCTCLGGQYHHMPVPCKHAALAARRLEREGLAVWRGGLWFPSSAAPALSDSDPFEGLS